MGQKTMGRPPLPAAMKAKKGTLQASRQGKHSNVHIMDALPPAPDWLGEEGKKQWAMLADQIDRMGIAAKGDTLALAAACAEWEAYLKNRKFQAENEAFYAIKDEDGNVKSWQPHPAHYIGNAHFKNFMDIIAKFGFTPSDRQKLALQPPAPKEQTTAARLLKKTA